MANKTISELTNAALPLAGTDKTIVSRDGVTLNDVLLSDLKSYIGTSGFVSTAFSTTLAFDGVNKEMIQQAVTGALAFISSGSTLGTQINMCLVANGTNVPTFATNFKEATGSSGYDNTANVKNYFQFIYSNNRVLYSTFQEVGDTGVAETLPVNTVAPVLSAVTVGGALSCTNGTWTGNPTPTYTQQFKLDGVNIASNYTVVSGDVGKVVTCVVTATNSQGVVNATSNSQTVAASAGDADYANVKLLAHFDGADNSTTFTDNSSSPRTLTAVGNAKISTTQSKFGGASGLFDGTGDSVTIVGNQFHPTNGDFTVEAWIYMNSLKTQSIVSGASTPNGDLNFVIKASGFVFYATGEVGASDFAQTWSTGTWYHVAVTKSGTTLRGFVDGVLVGTRTESNTYNNTTTLYIGARSGSAWDFDGYIDDLRMTQGVARYTANFSVPTAAFPNS